MTVLGINDLKQKAIPATWDAGELERLRLADGTTYAELVNDIAGGLALVNAELMAIPLVSGLISVTTDLVVEYPVGVSNGYEDHTEYGEPDQKRGKVTGHMLPLRKYDRGLGWTYDMLEDARRSQLDADIASLIADTRNLWVQKILTRLFKSTYDSVGSSGKSCPIADGGTADSAYVPVNYPERADAFDSSHTHLQRLSGITQANLETAVGHIWEHGHDGPYELLVAQADLGDWQNTSNVTGYVGRAWDQVNYGSGNDTASVISPDVHGVVTTKYGVCLLRSNARIPTKYWAVFKSYGAQDQRNPLRVRYDARYGIGGVILAGDHIRRYPLENCISVMRFGVGVGEDRCAAVIVYNHTSGSYTSPTIS